MQNDNKWPRDISDKWAYFTTLEFLAEHILFIHLLSKDMLLYRVGILLFNLDLFVEIEKDHSVVAFLLPVKIT